MVINWENEQSWHEWCLFKEGCLIVTIEYKKCKTCLVGLV
jgi:hypothetical protein